MKIRLTLFVILLSAINLFAQHPNSKIRKGNTAYQDSAYSDAEQLYREALMKKQNSYEASFNMADAIYKQERYSEANSLFKALSEKTKDKTKKSSNYHNLGNSYLSGKGVEIDMKKAKYYWELAAINGDLSARYNLGCLEEESGNHQRAYKHFILAASAGLKQSLDAVKDGYMDGYVTKDEFANTLRAYHERQKEMKSDARDKAALGSD